MNAGMQPEQEPNHQRGDAPLIPWYPRAARLSRAQMERAPMQQNAPAVRFFATLQPHSPVAENQASTRKPCYAKCPRPPTSRMHVQSTPRTRAPSQPSTPQQPGPSCLPGWHTYNVIPHSFSSPQPIPSNTVPTPPAHPPAHAPSALTTSLPQAPHPPPPAPAGRPPAQTRPLPPPPPPPLPH